MRFFGWRWRWASLLWAWLCLGHAGLAQAVGRDGEGRIQAAVGATWIPNNPFTLDAREAGYPIGSPYSFGPHVLATFGYWLDDAFEIALEGGYHHAELGIAQSAALKLDTETLMGSLRWVFLQGYDVFPYVGVSGGYAFNNVTSPLSMPWGGCTYACGSWSATGYAGALMLGAGWDLSASWGVSGEVRYTLDLLQSPFAASLNGAGLSVLVGLYFRVSRSSDNSVIPGSP